MKKVVELFAGVGGFRCGLDLGNKGEFETIWANQWEPGRKNQFAFDCYNAHFSGSSVNVNEDIGLVRDEIPEHDLLVGGFPCQDYSVASTKARGIEGKKGVLWWHIDHIIKARRPKYVLLENVDRLIKSPTSQRGRDFGIILRCMADNGYAVEWRVINAADYGEVQRRRRIFIFACRDDTLQHSRIASVSKQEVISSEGFFANVFPVDPEPIYKKANEFSIDASEYATLVDVSDRFAEPFFSAGVMIGHDVYTRDVVPKYDGPNALLQDIMVDQADERYMIADLAPWEYMMGSKKIMRTAKNGHEYLYTEGAIPFPDPTDRPGRTMLTSEGSKNRSTHVVTDKTTGKLRLLTPLECERMNGFPDDWTDRMTDRQRYFTMGNALVVGLIRKMGAEIAKME